jgi:hypothetical protein
MATINVLLESMRPQRSATRRKNRILVIAGPHLGQTLSRGSRPLPRHHDPLAAARFKQGHDFRRSMLDFLTKRRRFRTAKRLKQTLVAVLA